MSDPLGLVLSKLGVIHKSRDSYSAACPAHDDNKPSLSVSVGRDQPVVLHCHAGCSPDEILRALDLTWADLSNDQADSEWTPHGPAIDVYDYRDENGTLLFQVLRTADKQFPQRRPDSTAKSGWSWKLGDTRRVLYRLRRVIDAVSAGEVIYVVEGEKDVHSLEAIGKVATCNPGGAGKWRPEYSEFLRDAHVKVIADTDEPGRKHARNVAASLKPVAATVTVCEPPKHKDITEHLRSGGTLDDLEVTSQADDVPELAMDVHDLLAGSDEYDWLVPDLLERGDRLVITGFEGFGKSTLIRQFAVRIAAGIHPFEGTLIDGSKRVLYVDCENGIAHSRRKFRPLVQSVANVGHPVPKGQLRVVFRPEGLHLVGADDRAWLLERVTAYRPDLLIIGPFYRLHRSNPNDESAARDVVAALDAARAVNGCALIVEAHAGHGDQIDRSVRPRGSSLLLGWPEFGYGLKPIPGETGDDHSPLAFVSWRGDRDDRKFPRRIQRGPYLTWVSA